MTFQAVLLSSFLFGFAASNPEMDKPNPDMIEMCYKDLRWKGDLREKCTKVTGWSPRTRLWEPFMTDPMVDEHGVDQKENVTRCLDEAMDAYKLLSTMNIVEPVTSVDSKERGKPEIVYFFEDETDEDKIKLVEIENAIDEEKVYAVKSMAGCLRKHLKKVMFEHRPFPDNIGGNDCTFVSVFLPMFLPGVSAHIQKIGEMGYLHAGWNENPQLPPVRTLGIRTSEHLSYGRFKQGLGSHIDEDSTYTVIFALTNPDHYGGGEFFIMDKSPSPDSDEDMGEIDDPDVDPELPKKTLMKADQYSAFVFLSLTDHGVEPITHGHREMFTNEFWVLEDAPYPHNRAYADEVEAFGWKVDENGGQARNVSWPTDEETDEMFLARNRTRRHDDEDDEDEDDEDRDGEEMNADEGMFGGDMLDGDTPDEDLFATEEGFPGDEGFTDKEVFLEDGEDPGDFVANDDLFSDDDLFEQDDFVNPEDKAAGNSPNPNGDGNEL